ncbi:hypothetical protein [Bradyrhizobium sp. S3.2.12]|uniref:hypothetical protein n=1 Tax=Bradyrhizobium sp. S3.2.12 TaxID=3156387 RepID=UPI003397D07F
MATLGMLCLANRGAYVGQDAWFDPGITESSRYAAPPKLRRIPGAWTNKIVPGDPALEGEFVKGAQELVRDGANAITSNCGFTIRFQQAIAKAVDVPVATSSLLLLPMLLASVPADKKIAVLTYDSRYLDAGIMKTLGIADSGRLVIEGLQGTKTYDYMSEEDGRLEVADALYDTDAIIERLGRHRNISAILCECTFFVRVSRRIAHATGLPVYDAALNTSMLMTSLR